MYLNLFDKPTLREIWKHEIEMWFEKDSLLSIGIPSKIVSIENDEVVSLIFEFGNNSIFLLVKTV